MSTDEKYDMKGLLSDLFNKAKEGGGPDIVLLRDEIKKKSTAGDKTLEKFLELVDTFQDVLPKEKQRYSVAIRALHTTTGVSRQKVLESADSQLGELRRLEKGALSDMKGFRDELSDMDSRLKETKSELAKLREKVADLEKEEKEILGVMAARERARKAVEEAVKKVFTDVTAEISGIKKKIEDFTGEKVSPQPAADPESVEGNKNDENKKEEEEGVVEEQVTIGEPPAVYESQWVRKCPMCGGDINFLVNEAKWMCYSCGHEEVEANEA